MIRKRARVKDPVNFFLRLPKQLHQSIHDQADSERKTASLVIIETLAAGLKKQGTEMQSPMRLAID